MQKLTHRLRAAGLGLALLLVTLTLVSMPAEATNPNGCHGTGTVVTYYSDATFTNVVGQYTTSCNGACSGSGRVTIYYTEAFLSCPPPPDPA